MELKSISETLAIKKEKEILKTGYVAVLKYFKYMCDAYETFEELSENEDDPKQLLENLKSIKEYVFQDLQTAFNEMKSMISRPKCFLIQHFDDVRNKIDLECQNYLDNDELELESKEKAILRQQETIEEVDSFQKKCLAYLKTEQKHQINLEEFEKRLQLQDKDDVMELGKDLCCAIHNIKRELFMNQGIVFYEKENFEKLFGNKACFYQREIDSVMFGNLILIEDEFLINSDKIESWSEYRFMIDEFKEEQIEVDCCNEFLAIHLLEKSIFMHFDTNQFGQAVNRVRLNRTQQNGLDRRFFYSDEILAEKWSSDLPGLKKFYCDRLREDKRIFQHLVNLEELYISQKRLNLAKTDSNTFACNKNLRILTISSNELTLNSQIFNRLVNLTELDLPSNQIDVLPDGLFDSCKALKIVNLSYNKIIKLETSTFQNLVNLEELHLSSNFIKEIDSNMFRCNKKLFKLGLDDNKITQLNEDFLKGMYQLIHLRLDYNEIVSLPEGSFDSCLKVVELSHNKLIILETSTLENLINLEELDLSNNSIERADYSNIFAHNKNLRKLNISYNSNTSLSNQSFNRLNLTELNLEYCEISNLTQDLFNGLVNLTDLYLNGNKIMSLPDGIFHNLTNLKYLNLSYNQISELPNDLFHSLVNLNNLDLGVNEITNIPNGLFDNLISLTFLNLHKNKIEFQEDSDPNIFIGLRELTRLDLDYNQISILPEGIFKHLVSLEELGIEQNPIVSLPKEFFKGLGSLEYRRFTIETEDGNFLKKEKKIKKSLRDNPARLSWI